MIEREDLDKIIKTIEETEQDSFEGVYFFSEIKLFDFVKSIQHYAREDALKEIDDRLMPEGAEWPKFEDGEPVLVGDEFETMVSGTKIVDAIKFEDGDIFSLEFNNGCDTAEFYKNARVKRPEHRETLQDVIDDFFKKTTQYWKCPTIPCSKCPSEINGKTPNDYYGTTWCDLAKVHDIKRRLEAIQERMGGEE